MALSNSPGINNGSGIKVIWNMIVIASGIVCYLIESATGALPCKETKRLFQDIQKKLDTPLPINYAPAFITIILIVLIIFFAKTIYDVVEHKKRMNYINQWDAQHLGENGIRNEVYIPYPSTKQRHSFSANEKQDLPTTSA